ncbi:hypothetical protein D9M09_16850 [Janthinobacterium agaricidamnosum]|uniref:Uncharacterized protein n=1 Tax=Janthinobacterium agaricidamnosum TaxID=55508 RepID=A0A3G2EAX6_9BURK|nr:hypothetical protein D9M09_16850 [Janthinobacterium agaricidamnosum]
MFSPCARCRCRCHDHCHCHCLGPACHHACRACHSACHACHRDGRGRRNRDGHDRHAAGGNGAHIGCCTNYLGRNIPLGYRHYTCGSAWTSFSHGRAARANKWDGPHSIAGAAR